MDWFIVKKATLPHPDFSDIATIKRAQLKLTDIQSARSIKTQNLSTQKPNRLKAFDHKGDSYVKKR